MKKRWPKTPDGVRDWESIFETPDTGLIAVVSQAHSSAILNSCVSVIVSNLFSRRGDEVEAARFMALLKPVIEDAERTKDIDAARNQVIDILRQVKTKRVEKADAYVHEKRLEREAKRQGKGAAGKTHWVVIAAAALVVMVFGGGLSLWMTGNMPWMAGAPDMSDAPTSDTPDAPDASGQAAEAKPPAKTNPADKPRSKDNDARKKAVRKKPPSYPQAVLFKPVVWSIRPTRGNTRFVAYQPFLVVNDEAAYEKVCTNRPWVTDAIFLRLNRVHPNKKQASPDDLAKISRAVLRQINERYGKNTVSRMQLVNNSHRRFQGTVRGCAFEFGKPKSPKKN